MNYRYRTPVVLLILFGMLSGCSQPAASSRLAPDVPAEKQTDNADPSTQAELTLWSYFDIWDDIIEQFNLLYPNVKVQVKVIPYAEHEKAYLEALASKHPPDILMVDSTVFDSFNGIRGLENLLDPPYDAGRYKDSFSPAMWENSLSLDRSRLVSFPIATSPTVTYYRKDIMEQYGFPADPEELGNFMENPDNWIEMAKTLKQHNIWMTQWSPEVVQLHERTQGILSRELDYNRNNASFRQAVDLAKQVNELGLASHLDVWTEGGQEALRNGSIAMLYMGTWGTGQLKEWAPETAGLWRETRLPFNLFGWQNSSNFVLPSDGKHKLLAWKFIEFTVTEYTKQGLQGTVPAYLPSRSNPKELAAVNPFLGNQQSYRLHEELVAKMKESLITPINRQAEEISYHTLTQGIENRLDTADILEQIEQEINSTLHEEIEILKGNRSR